MKASLVSATSLLAILVFEGSAANAGTITLTPSATTYNFGYELVTIPSAAYNVAASLTGEATGSANTLAFGAASGLFSGGGVTTTLGSKSTTGALSSSFTFTPTITGVGATSKVTVSATNSTNKYLTLTGTGVAPIEAITVANNGRTAAGATLASGNLGYVLVNDPTYSSSVTITVSNAGNGNLAAATTSGTVTLNNLNGTVGGSSSSVFVGTGGTLGLNDSTSTITGATTTRSFVYNFAPTSNGAQTATVVTTLLNGSGANTGNTGQNLAGNVTTTLTATGVAPIVNVTSTASAGYVLLNKSTTATLTVSNSGNGNLSKTTSSVGGQLVSNLNGTLGGASTSGFSGTGAVVTLGDSASQTVSYVYTPTVRGASSVTVSSPFTDGNAGNTSGTVTSTLIGTGVAPVVTVASTLSAGYVLVKQSNSVGLTVTNTGDGNRAGATTAGYNLIGTIGGASASGFSGTATAVNLGDTASQTITYVYTPTVRGASTTTVSSPFTDGNAGNASGTVSTALIGTGVAPIASVSSAVTVYGRLGATGTTGTATIAIANTGNGNLAGTGTAFNLNGTITAPTLGAQFGLISNPGTVSLLDSSSSTVQLSYTPLSARGTSTSIATISFSDGNANGTNGTQTVSTTVAGYSVGPTYQSKWNSVTDTPTADAKGATLTSGPTLSMTVATKASQTYYLNLSNITTDLNGGNASLTDLTIESFSFAGANASSFSIGGTFTAGTVIHEGSSVLLPIVVTGGSANGWLNSSLTIFTDESVGLAGTGDTFTYTLVAYVPEPASLAALGAGLAGLAWARRRRRKV